MWDDIELLTSDDTGSGCLSIGLGEEHGTTLYQVDTLVKISSEKASFSPKLHACSSSDGFIIVVDQSVTLFDNICRCLQLHLQFDTKVDVVGLCQGGQFLLVGERSGNLHLIHVTSKQTLLSNAFVQEAPDENQCTYHDLIIEEDGSKEGTFHVFLLTHSGLFCIMDLQLKQIQEAIEKKAFRAAKELQGQTKTNFIATENYHNLGCSSFVIGDLASENHVIIGGTGHFALSKWELDPENKVAAVKNFIDSDMIKGVKKVQLTDNLLFILDTANVLSLWDIYTLIPVWNWPSTCFEDFILTTEADSSSSVTWQDAINLKLIALTTSSNQMRNLMVYSLPTMTLLYSLEVSAVSSLVRTGISSDTIYLLEGIYENDHNSPEGLVSIIVLRCLTEALPENRLSRLLHKHKFTEAENFAISFGLDVELVYKVKSNDLLERMALCSVNTHEPTVWQHLVDEAKQSLCKIKDDQFVVDYCLKAQWPTFETTQEMLNYAKARLLKKDDKMTATFSNSLTEVLKARAKLATFYGAFGPDKFSGINWIEFLKSEDILKDIFLQLKEGNLFCAQFLWLRHRADFESRFDVNTLDNLLNSISTSIPVRELCWWLQSDVIPFVKRVLPDGQRILAKWLEQAARNLELTDKANWPENGLEVAQVFFMSENPDSLGLTSSCHYILSDYQNTEEVCHLRELVKNLQELIKLYRKYNCKLALSEFEKESTTTIVFRMLDKVLAPELIPSVLEKYVKLYMKEHNLEEEPLLLLYIKDMLERYSCKSASLFETSWESKAMAIIGCLSDVDLIFDAVLQIMYGAVVPWSTAVEQLVKKHLEMDHPKVKLLQESYNLMEMKKLLRGYGIRDANLLNKEIMRVIRYILKQNGPTSLEDALKVAQAYLLSKDEVYSLKIIDLMSREQGEECLYLLKSLPPAEAEKTAERVIMWARLALQEEPDNSQEDKMQRISIARTTVNIIKALCDIQKENPLKMNECEENLKIFKTIRSLQEDFQLFLPFEGYRDHSLVAGLHEEPFDTQEDSQPKQKLKTPEETPTHPKNASLRSSLYRQTLCLLVSEQNVEAEVVLKALRSGRVEEALQLCRDLFQYHRSPNTGRVLLLTCQKLCQMLGADAPVTLPEGFNLPLEIHQLACQAATICSPDFLLDALEMCKYALTAMEIYRQCQMEDCGTLTKTSFGADRDPYEEWIYNDFFSEDGIVLESQLVLPVIYELISSLIHASGNKKYPLESASLPYCSFNKEENLLLPIINPISALLQSLQESSQWELALKFVVGSFGTCLQHGMSNCMDMSLSEKLYEERLLINTKSIVVGMKENSTALIRKNAAALLHKVFNCRLVDLDLALGYCTLLPKKDVFEIIWRVIDGTWQNYNKILAVSQVGAQLAYLYEEAEMRLKFQELITDAWWGLRLGKLGISFQPVFREHSLRKKELMSTLVKNRDVDTALILAYCSTYDLDSDAALQLFIETLILQHNHINHCGEDSAMYSLKQAHPEVLAKALEIVPLLKSTRNLVVSLSGILYKLDPYDYEIIEVILKIMQKADEKVTNININQGLSLVKHLKSYRRASPPGNLEHEYVMKHTMSLSSAAQTRLPFHLIFFGKVQNFWKILSAELREESFPTFLLIAKLMKVSLDSLYVSTAKQVFEKSLKPKLLKQVQAQGSTLNNKEIAKICQTLQSYLLSIANPEWAVAVAVNFAQDIPEGFYKITTLKFCLYLAEKWLKNIPSQDETHDKAEALLKQLSLQYQRSGTETVLITRRLNAPEYLRLLGKPAQLIASLYEHSSIPLRNQGPAGQDHPDIHAAAKEIAEMNNLDLEKIWDALLEKWLCPTTQTNEMPSEFFNIQGDEALQRVLYLLQIRPIDYSTRMLFLVATSSVSPRPVDQLTFAYRRRALHCLLCLADRETIESLFKKPFEEVKCFLQCITFLAAFEMLNIPLTYESFHNSPKEGMIKGLWKNHSHEPLAVRLVTELCLEYKVYDTQLWSGLLQKLLGFNMINYLRNVLTAISNIHSLWQIPYFGRAWQRVSQIPLMSASCPLGPAQLLACRESLVVLLECPVSMDLDMVGVAKQYSQLELPAFALACLLLMPHSEKRDQQLQNFLSWCNPETVLQQVDEHMNTGRLAGFACQVSSFILNHVINKKQFGMLTNTKYFPLLKSRVIRVQKVKELVNYLIHDDSLDEAAVLITEYLKQCGNPVPLDTAPCDIVKMFLSESK